MATYRDRYILEIETQGATRGLGGVSSALGSIKGLGMVAAFAAIAAAIKGVASSAVEATKSFENYRNQLSLITSSAAEMEATMQLLNDAAVANRQSFEGTVDLYTKLTLATESLGVSQDRVLRVVGNFQKALAISGADAGTAAGAIRQFGQAMASGTVRGDEFNSIVEALGPAIAIMARESGLTVGKLREMSQAGELTAETFFKMVEGSRAIETAFGNTRKTIAQLQTELGDATNAMLANFAEQTGAAELYRGILEGLARSMRELGDAQTSIEGASLADLVNNASLGPASERLKEFNRDTEDLARLLAKIEELQSGEAIDVFGIRLAGHNQTLKSLLTQLGLTEEQFRSYRAALEAAAQSEGAAAEAAQAELQALQDNAKAANEALAPYRTLLATVDEFAKANDRGRSALEKATAEQAKAAEVLQQLRDLIGTTAAQYIPDLNDKIAIAQTRYSQLTAEIERLNETVNKQQTFEGFYTDLINGSKAAVAELGFAREALAALAADLSSGKLTQDQYAEAVSRVNNLLDNANRSTRELAAAQRELNQAVERYQGNQAAFVEQYKLQTSLINLSEKEQEVAITTFRLQQDMQAALIPLQQRLVELREKNTEASRQEAAAIEAAMASIRASYGETLGQVEALVDARERELNILKEKQQLERLQQFIARQNFDAQEEIIKLQDEMAKMTLPAIEQKYYDIAAAARAQARAAIAAEEARRGTPLSAQEQQAYYDAAVANVERLKQVTREHYEMSREWSTGWSKAINDYVENATNGAKTAEKVFQKATQGMEDAIVNFAKTGKFEWKSFVASILEELLRAQIQRTIANVFNTGVFGGPTSTGGGNSFGSLLGFANGGLIPTNKPVLVGERGPELLSGAAGMTVTPNNQLGGVTNVTYNISAVDALSFKQLVARDPGFIHAVATKGGAGVPVRR